MGSLTLYLHFLVASLIVLVMHILTPIVALNTIARVFGGDLLFQIMPFLSVGTGLGISYLYMRAFKVEKPFMRALISTVTGTVLFLGSCLAFVCSIANYPPGW